MQLKDAQMILTGPHAFANFDYSVTPKSLAFSSRHGILATKAWERKCLPLSFTHFITLQAQL